MIVPKHPIAREVESLCHELVEGSFDEQKQQRIEQLVSENPEALQAYIEYINLHVALADCTEEDLLPTTDLPNSNGDLSVPTLSMDLPITNHLISNVFLGLLLVGLTVITLVGAWTFGKARNSQEAITSKIAKVQAPDPGTSAGESQKSKYVAELTWLGATNEKGDYLHSPTASTLTKGKTLLIQDGNVHVKFACGAEVTLHGPAVFHIETEKLARLEYGSLEAKVPPEAIGFLIDTPASRVIDLGTEFAVSVADNGNTNINVINGEVETESWRPNLLGIQPRRKLFEGDSLRLSPPVTKSFRTDFDTPDALEVFDIVRHDPAKCLLDPVAGLLTLKTQTGSIYKDKNNNSNILVVPIPDCNFDAILKVKRFEPKQLISHVSLATLDDQDNVYRISYWMSFRNYKRGLTSTKEENTQHSFVRNNKGQEDTLFDAGDRPFKLRIVRKESTISTYWSEESGPWVSNGEMPCKFKPRFIGFFAAEPNPSKGQNRELIDCVIDSFELKLVTPER